MDQFADVDCDMQAGVNLMAEMQVAGNTDDRDEVYCHNIIGDGSSALHGDALHALDILERENATGERKNGGTFLK
jgi:hypothetical protein